MPPAPLPPMKSVALVAQPPGLRTLILPVVAPTGTVAVILPWASTVKVVTVPLSDTLAAR